ncbi:MAG: tRNA 2-thiouridine(34) synthase MnmA [Candidatus Dormibacteria bacterium]
MAARPADPARVPEDPLDLLPAGAVVAVAMSGGVDSSVAAARLVERGVSTLGITLAMWPRSPAVQRDRGCCGVDAVDDARRVAVQLGIPHYAWNLEGDFKAAVIADFEDGYASGRTPNPCVRCNERIKFGVLLDRAEAVGATHLATGHHARTGRRRGLATLHRSANRAKDQAYTLHRVAAERLQRAVFPLGSISSKELVRAEARRLGLRTAEKPDSQELCFVDARLSDELETRLAGRYRPGPIVDGGGRQVGQHRGLPFLTVGQRSGLGLAPSRPDAPPMHVLRLDPSTNTVAVGPREALRTTQVVAGECRWVDRPPPVGGTVGIQLHAHGEEHTALVEQSGPQLRLRCAVPVSRVAPGQAVVVYSGDEVLGGGLVAPEMR